MGKVARQTPANIDLPQSRGIHAAVAFVLCSTCVPLLESTSVPTSFASFTAATANLPVARPGQMWRELITSHTEDATFAEPSTSSEVMLAGDALGAPFPDSLRAALCESNGIDGEYGLGLLWPVARIVADNQSFRSNADFRQLYMPFDNLLFFADAGNGDQFAFVVLDGEVRRNDIFVWNHEDDSRSWIAPTLQTFYEWWLTGRIEL